LIPSLFGLGGGGGGVNRAKMQIPSPLHVCREVNDLPNWVVRKPEADNNEWERSKEK
jgi:hypothetical protein